MHIFKEIAPLRTHLSALQSTHSTVGFVPTMGALHEGHLSLIRASKKENKITVCSIYVNPTQFGNQEDLSKYPRTLDKDIFLLERESCDVLFCPENNEMYSSKLTMTIAFDGLDNVLEGEFRPGHFSGVARVVAKLFNIVQPQVAYFGQKDFQQVMVINRLVEELKFNVKICLMPIVREADGLAMSSRNQRLSPKERQDAGVLHRVLLRTRDGIEAGKSLHTLRDEALNLCIENNATLEYLSVADRKQFNLLEEKIVPGEGVILIAAKVGPVRLIDNLFV
jgi:pantoate--beta-alanine ligase